MDFDDMSDDEVRDYANSVLNVRQWMIVTGNRRIEEFHTVRQLWDQARSELDKRGLLADFKAENGMD